METPELLSVASGLFVGLLLGLLRPSLRVWVGALLAIPFGVLATVASGEFLISWGFVLIDIPLVAVSAAVGVIAIHRVRFVRRPR